MYVCMYRNWFLQCNNEHCFFKYVSFMLVDKCKSRYSSGCSYRNVYSSITETKSDIRHHDISDNGSTLRGGMLSKVTSCKSAWACLNDRFAMLSLVSHDVGKNGDFFLSLFHMNSTKLQSCTMKLEQLEFNT